MDIRKIAMYLAGKLPPYYWSSNLRTFTKKLREFAKEEFTNEEMLFIQQQAKWIDEEIYFIVLDDLRKDSTEEKEEWKKSKQDIINILKELNIPDEILDIDNNLTLWEFKDEEDFTKNFLIPFFRKLWYKDIKNTHWKKEYGKDILMRKMDEFWNRRYIWVQAKIWNISWKVNWSIDELIWQISDGFWMKVPSLDAKDKVSISEFIIATNWLYTENATEKIIEKITEASQRNNITFLDKEKIESLLKN